MYLIAYLIQHNTRCWLCWFCEGGIY